MTTLEHKGYGSMGSEFIVHHYTLHPKRLFICLVVTTTLSATFKLYEMDVAVLWMMSFLLAIIFIFRLANKVSKEVLMVFPSLGVQVKTQYWLGGLETHFFDKSMVKGIVINEAVTMHSVLSYLAVLLTSGTSGQVEQVYPLFTRSWPCLRDLVYVYQTVENMSTDRHTSSKLLGSAPPETCRQFGAGDTTKSKISRRIGCNKSQTLSRSKRHTRSSKS